MRSSWLIKAGNLARRHPRSSWGVRARLVTTTAAVSFASERSHILPGGKAALGGTQNEYPQQVAGPGKGGSPADRRCAGLNRAGALTRWDASRVFSGRDAAPRSVVNPLQMEGSLTVLVSGQKS